MLGTAQVDRHQSADALLDHRHAEQAVHAAHGDRVVRDDQVTRLGFAGHRVEQIAEAFDIGVVERRIDFVQYADRCGVGEEQAEDQGDGGERLFAARQQSQRLQFLAGWLCEDFESGLQRVVAVD